MEEVKNVENEKNIEEKPQEPNKMSKGKIIGIIIAVIFALGLFASLLGTTEEDETDDLKYTYHDLKEEFVFYDLNYTATSYGIDDYWSSKTSFADASPENENNLLCFVDMKMYNPTNKTITLKDYLNSNISYNLICDDIKYNTKWGYSDDYLMSHDDIDARETIEAVLLFEAPKEVLENAQKIELRISLNKTNAKDIHIVKLKG